MKSLVDHLSQYAAYHRDPRNIASHFIGIPLIVVAVAVLREFAVVITSVLLAGRSSSSFAAEIGSMRMNQEVDAMQVMGVNPFQALVIPRLAAMVLMMANAFALGYRRYEWKCNALNLPSRQAALRLGFHYEGTFRQARVDKGHNRDTAWFSVIDSEWPALKGCFERWLEDGNFDHAGRQRRRLSELTAACRSGAC